MSEADAYAIHVTVKHVLTGILFASLVFFILTRKT